MKKKTIHLLSKSLLTKLALVVALFLGNVSLAVADELTVYSTNTSSHYAVPVAGEYVDSKNVQSEFVIPASELESMQGGVISKMSFFIKTVAKNSWGDAEFKVYMKEVDFTAFPSTAFSGYNDATIVYEGALDAQNEEMEITFTTPFTYSRDEKNLLVGFYCKTMGTKSNSVYYYGYDKGSYAADDRFSVFLANSQTGKSFIPRTKFVYTPTAMSTPKLSVDNKIISMGSLRANYSKTITVKNKGVGTMDVNIAFKSATTDYTLSETSLTGIGAGESKTFDVNFLYDANDLGVKNATITVTPTYNNADVIDIAVTATAADPNVWEDFSEGIPTTWYRSSSSFWIAADGRARGTSTSGYYLRTPRLLATTDAKVSFDVEPQASSTLKAEYSTDCINWTTIDTYSESGNKSFAAPADGYYWLRFSGKGYVDNFAGWTVATPALDMLITSQTLSLKGTTHGEYTGTLNILERGGVSETVNVELYFGENMVAEQTNYAISGNSECTFNLSYTPTEEWAGQAYFKVVGANIGTIESDKVNVTISEPTFVLNEDVDVSSSKPTCSSAVIKVLYTPKAGWNTIVMPFSLSSTFMEQIFGKDYTAYALSSYADGALTFTNYNYLSTSTPYLVYAPNAVAHPEGVYLQNVSVNSSNWTSSYLSQQKGDACFKGTFAPMPAGTLTGKYGVTNGGGIAKAGAGASMKGYRAYLELPAGATARILVIDNNGETTDLGFVKLIDQEAKAVYNLSGQRVEKGRKGLYIVNGKKVVVK